MADGRRSGGGSRQLDLFAAFIGDVPLRDDREGMSVPMVSLAKGKRTTPIEWRSSDGERYVRVTANATHGMGTIWDLDVLLWAVSQLNTAVEEGRPVSPTISFQPYDMLRTIGRGVSGRHYSELEDALRRLKGTVVETNIRAGGARRIAMFGLLEDWAHNTDDITGRSKGMTLTLSRWMFEGVVKHRDVLAVTPEYFELSSGIARFLYRIARRHGGKQDMGWRFTMRELHARSGSMRAAKDFAKDVRRVVATQGVPEYRLDLVEGQHGDELVVMTRDPVRVGLPQRRDLTSLRKVQTKPQAVDRHVGSRPKRHVGSRPRTRGITPQTSE